MTAQQPPIPPVNGDSSNSPTSGPLPPADPQGWHPQPNAGGYHQPSQPVNGQPQPHEFGLAAANAPHHPNGTPIGAEVNTQKKKKRRRFGRKQQQTETLVDHKTADERTAKAQKWKRIRIASLAALLVVLLGGGIVVGWVANQVRQSLQQEPAAGVEYVEVPISAIQAGTTMPDLRGMTKNDALAALSDAGFPTSKVTIEEKSRGGISDVVIEQKPAPGDDDLSEITLIVSKTATVPEIIGLDRTEALSKVRELGSEAEMTEVFRAEEKPGTVLEVNPKVGEPMGSRVTMTVAAAGSSIYLSSVDSIDGGCSSTSERLDGKQYPQSMECRTDDEKGYAYEWDLQKRVAAVEMMVGISDSESDTGGSVSVVAFVDGKEVARASATFGKPAKLFVPTEDGLRLRLVATGKAGSDDSYSTPSVVLGDARMIGTSDQLAVFGSDQ